MKTQAGPVLDPSHIKPLEFKQAIVALELGKTDEPMLDFFQYFAKEIPVGAAYFVHVLPRVELYNPLQEAEPRWPSEDYELNDEITQRMEWKVKDRFPPKGNLFVEFDMREGDPLEEILKDAEDVKADLVVIGQRTDSEVHGILARNLVRKIQGNALIVPDRVKPPITRILIPVDFSANSIRALQVAVAMNKRLDQPAELICLNVYEMPDMSIYRTGKTREQLQKMIETDRMSAFKAFIHTYAPEWEDQIRTVLVEKDLPGVARFILEYAEENGVNFIATGARGHSKVDLLLMGSVTEKLMSINESIPVLVVK